MGVGSLIDQTPIESAMKIMDWIIPQIDVTDDVLEAFKGDSVIYDLIPNTKDYCEIKEGRDFFTYNTKVDWIISNPPFQTKNDVGEMVNAFIPIINKSIDICNKGFFYLINHKLWSALAVKRLRDWESLGWVISGVFILEIKIWYGRYYIVKFEKNGKKMFQY